MAVTGELVLMLLKGYQTLKTGAHQGHMQGHMGQQCVFSGRKTMP